MTIRTPALKSQVELLKAAMLQAGTPLASGVAHEIVAKLNGYPSWNVASKAGSPDKKLPAKVLSPSQLLTTFEVNMVDVLGLYEAPEDLAAWKWVESIASFRHVENGIGDGIWEFLVRAEAIPEDLEEVPTELHPWIQESRAIGAKWIMFSQW